MNGILQKNGNRMVVWKCSKEKKDAWDGNIMLTSISKKFIKSYKPRP